MGIVEKKVNEMEMLEGKARMEKWVDEYIEKQDEKNKIIENIMSSTYYIEWLNHFTQDKNGFSDDDWLYSSDKLSDFDRKNVEMLKS